MSNPSTSGYIRYLAAKQRLDDRSLNRQVWDCLVRAVQGRPAATPLRILEVGCGIGTMVERLLDWGLLVRAHYTGIDVEAEFIREARRRLRHYAEAKRAGGGLEEGGAMIWTSSGQDVRVFLRVADLADFLDREQGRAAFDLLVAHAFLDLVDLPATLPRLLSLLPPGGLFYFTLNFDGATILEPPIDPDLDRRIIARYHETMDTRRVRGRPSGSSVTGRRLLRHLKEGGATVAAAGSSDWLVFPGPAGYPGDEAYFLHFIIDTIGQALLGHPEPDPERFRAWIARRHAQIEVAELVYMAHQVDVMGYI
jgi:SAM-dependent methyltransferase